MIQRLSILCLACLLPPLRAWAVDPVTLVSASGYGNFHAGGVVVTVGGDDNRNASVALEWRPAGGTYQPAHPLARIDATHFAGSLFWLSPATAYDARVTVSDPDGVTGPPTATTTVQTRPDTLPEPTLRTLYVSPSGNDTNPGTSPGAPLRTIQRAADLSQAGDLILIQPGVYREAVSVPQSGTASQPIVFRGNGAGAILDGADAAIAGGVAWSPQGGGIYSRVTGFATGHVVTEAGRLFRYGTLADLQALGAGAPGGFHFDGTRVYVKFANGSGPSAHTMHVARLEDGFVIDGRSFVRVENLEIRHQGAGDYGKGIYLRYSSDCAVKACRIHEVGAAGVWVKGGSRHRIEDNELWDTSIFGWPWDFTKGSSAENNGVTFTDDVGRGNVVRRNVVHGTFNGMGPCGSAAPPSGVTNETDLYDNVLYQHTDDGFEPEGYCANVRLWGNRIRDVHMALAVAPAAPGPVYVVRNVAYRFGNTRTSQVDGYVASALKINSGYPTPIGPLYLYHNTFLTDAPATDAVALLNPGSSTFIRLRNNVVAGTHYALYKVNPVAWDGNGDDVYTTDPTRLVSWMGTRYDTLAAYQALGQELQGLSAPPLLTDPPGGDFVPLPASPLVDRGIVLRGINDGYVGVGPDVGAFESNPSILSIGDVSVPEGSSGASAAVLTVSLTPASGQTVTVAFATSNGTASAGSDYMATSGTLTFPPGAVSKTVSVPVYGDVLFEPNETFFVNLSGAANATLADGQGQGTITNDDGAGFTINDVKVVERRAGSTTATFTVTLAPTSGVQTSVDYATADGSATVAGGDYNSTSGTLTFPASTASLPIGVTVNSDAFIEGAETFSVGLTNPQGGPAVAVSPGTATILDPWPGGDFNSDGKADILWRHDVSGKNVVWYMDGITRTAGVFTSPDTLPDTNWRIVGTADFGADDKTDILFRHQISGKNVVWHMNGITRTAGVFTIPDSLADTNWKMVGTGDFSTDGKPDILWRHGVSGKNVVWTMDGVSRTGGVFTVPESLADTNWQMVGVGDYSSDGRVDILWRHNVSGKNVAWYMDGVVRTGGVFTNPDSLSDTNWKMVGVGDYSGDERPDILWRHGISGKIVVWYMDGITRTGGVFTNPSALPDTNWKIVGPK